jgi:hypothetical protein
MIVRQIQEDGNGATIQFQQGGQGRLAFGDANYETYLRLTRRSQERQHPVGVRFGEGEIIAELIRADNDVPTQLCQEDTAGIRVSFQGHDGVFYLNADHLEFTRLRTTLDEAVRQKTQVWFIAQKPGLMLLDVLPVGLTVGASHTYGGGAMRTAEFVGGPLDGLNFDSTQINAIATVIPVFTESGNRQFLLMPPRNECERILRGELTKEQVQGSLHPYERVLTASGVVTYRAASNGDFEIALQAREQPLNEEAQSRKQTFGELADRLTASLRSTKLTGATRANAS